MRDITLDIPRQDLEDVITTVRKDIVAALELAVKARNRADMHRYMEMDAHGAVQGAIGRLATWALPGEDVASRYTHCQLRIADKQSPEIVATYTDAAGSVTYVIAAVWHSTHWGYHS